MYSMGAYAVLGMSNQNVLSEDLEPDLFLNSAFQRLRVNCTTDSAHFFEPLSIRIITSRHYLSANGIKN